MGLTVRERRVLADIEQALAQHDPGLARQLSHMELRPAAEPGALARRVTKWCGAITLVLLVTADLAAYTGVLYGAGAAAVATLAAGTVARAAAHRERARRERAGATTGPRSGSMGR
jgi:hypothetical protein